MKKYIKYFISIIIIVVLALSLFFINHNKVKEVSGYTVHTDTYRETISGLGYVDYGDIIKIKTQVSGTVLEVDKVNGDNVTKGAVLVTIDDTSAQKDYEQLLANYDLAKARLEDYKQQYASSRSDIKTQRSLIDEKLNVSSIEKKQLEQKINKTQILVGEGITPQSDLDSLLNQLELLEAKMKSTEVEKAALNAPPYLTSELEASISLSLEQVEQQELVLDQYTITSPIEGKVLNALVEEGEFVQPGQEIFNIASTKDKYVIVSLDEKYLEFFNIGKEVSLILGTYAELQAKGVIDSIAPEVNLETGTIDITIKVMDYLDKFIKNMSVRVDIPSANYKNALVIPGDYIVYDSKPYVYTMDENNHVIKKYVVIYNRNVEKVMITDGLESGEIILNPLSVEEGQEVSLKQVID